MRYYCYRCGVEVDGIDHPALGIVCCMCNQTIAYALNGLRPNSRTRKLLKVAIRDNWICQLCQKSVDPHRTDENMKPTLDHRIPRSRGGCNALSNMQLAHGRCNRQKGNKRP